MTAEFKVDKKAFIEKLEADIYELGYDLAKPLKDAVDNVMTTETSMWQWPREPRTRDIFETGKLKASGRIKVKRSKKRPVWTFTYTTKYAAMTYYGGYIAAYGNPGNMVYLPPRPWVEVATSATSTYGFPAFDWKGEIMKALANKKSFIK